MTPVSPSDKQKSLAELATNAISETQKADGAAFIWTMCLHMPAKQRKIPPQCVQPRVLVKLISIAAARTDLYFRASMSA